MSQRILRDRKPAPTATQGLGGQSLAQASQASQGLSTGMKQLQVTSQAVASRLRKSKEKKVKGGKRNAAQSAVVQSNAVPSTAVPSAAVPIKTKSGQEQEQERPRERSQENESRQVVAVPVAKKRGRKQDQINAMDMDVVASLTSTTDAKGIALHTPPSDTQRIKRPHSNLFMTSVWPE